jgi:4-nitrophenyl phosphatase
MPDHWLHQCKGFLIDLDGTVYRGKQALPQAREFVEWLQQTGKRYLFVTNNSAPLPEELTDRLCQMGIPAASEHIFTSSQATVMYIKEHAATENPSYYAIGEKGLHTALQTAGFIYEEDNPDYVIVGIDREITYKKLMIASLAIQKGAVFLGTNADKRVPAERGLVPGAGALNAALATASGVNPVWVGKPEAWMLDYSMRKMGTLPKETVMIGDNLDTDVQAGANTGVRTVLLLTGYSKREDVERSTVKPTAVINDLTELLQILS